MEHGIGGLTDNNDVNSAALNSARVNVALNGITQAGSLWQLSGPRAVIDDWDNPFKGIFSQSSNIFNFNRNDDAFEAVNAYVHITNILNHINTTLGFSAMPFQYPGGLRFDPHGLNGTLNAMYIPGSGKLTFGEGGVDAAEDADVIVHETGHGVHDWLTLGSSSNSDGLSEGFGDYLAQSYSRSFELWTQASPQFNWIAKWYGHNEFWAGRVTNFGTEYRLVNNPDNHIMGQVFSTACIRILNTFGRIRSDRVIIEGIRYTNLNTLQTQAGSSIMQAGINLNYTENELCTMYNSFVTAGYTSSQLPQNVPPMPYTFYRPFNYTGTFTGGITTNILSTYNDINTATTTITLTNTNATTAYWSVTGGSVTSLSPMGNQAVIGLPVNGFAQITITSISTACPNIQRRMAINIFRNYGGALKVNVSPTLFSDIITIQKDKEQVNTVEARGSASITINEKFTIELFNSGGRILSRSVSDLDSPFKLPASNIPAGIYFLRIKNDDMIITKKLLKQ